MGFSITLLKVVDSSFVALIDAPADAAGWSPAVQTQNWDRGIDTSRQSDETADAAKDDAKAVSSNLTSKPASSPCFSARTNFIHELTIVVDHDFAAQKLKSALSNLIASESQITKFDTLVGDGDCGLCLKTGAEAVLKHLESAPRSSDAVRLVQDIAQVVEGSMDGTSGALYAIYINALASGLQSSSTGAQQEITPQIWAAGLQAALTSLAKYTPAQPGDRTVVDALAPFVATLAQTLNLGSAVEAASKGCDSTKGMEASLGRSVYVSAEGWDSCPDPGAYGLVKLLEGLLK
jgi:dihydroxyacetone kinase